MSQRWLRNYRLNASVNLIISTSFRSIVRITSWMLSCKQISIQKFHKRIDLQRNSEQIVFIGINNLSNCVSVTLKLGYFYHVCWPQRLTLNDKLHRSLFRKKRKNSDVMEIYLEKERCFNVFLFQSRCQSIFKVRNNTWFRRQKDVYSARWVDSINVC